MKWKIGSLYHGFRLMEERQLDDIYSLAKVFQHEKTGAKLIFLENEDDNKVFSVTFRTLPQDDTGVAHILEHSVLCGSRKFPVSKPFVELAKGSLKTFLNAFTYPDKTMYPVASRNKKDFRNLMDVYLDAVFYPNIYTNTDTFQQEGWHYELENTADELTYKGVVYNEMKGAVSAPDTILRNKIMETLFSDNIYRFNSGGDPKDISKLTREKFLEFHAAYYHPANAYLFLYGNTDVLEDLRFIHEEYLSKFEKKEVYSQIVKQQPQTQKIEKEFPYPVSRQEDTANKTILSMNFVIGEAGDTELIAAFDILTQLLLNSPAAPVKNALLAAGIGKNVQGWFNSGLLQPVISIVTSSAQEDDQEGFVRVVKAELKRLVENGIDKKLIEAAINRAEFSLREASFGYPKGLVYNMMCLDSWLYDQDPLGQFNYTAIFRKLRAALNDRYFERLIETYLLNNVHQSLVVLQPKPGLAEEERQALLQELAEYKAAMLPSELAVLVENTQKLKKRQQILDTPEALAAIPQLTLEDIPKSAPAIPVEEKREAGIPVLFQPIQTDGISYVSLYFDTRRVPQPQLPYVYLLAKLLGQVSTEKYNYRELDNEINFHTGGIMSYVSSITEAGNYAEYSTKFVVRAKALTVKLTELSALLKEVLGNSSFADGKRLQDLIREIKAGLDMSLFARGQEFASVRVLSYFSPAARHQELGMLGFYDFVAGLEQKFAARSVEIADNLAAVAQLIFTSDNLVAGVTLDKADYARFQSAFSELWHSLPISQAPLQQYQLECETTNQGLMAAGQVQYVVKAANFQKADYGYHGSLRVVENILSLDYLWNRVRVQGGAYGSRVSIHRNGNILFTSYRDPNLKETLIIYDGADNYLKNISLTERELTKYIIGAINQLDPPRTPEQKGEYAATCYFEQVSQDGIQREWSEVLATTGKEIRKAAEIIGLVRKQNYLCAFGSEQKIRDNKDLFQHLYSVEK